jgi:RND family efflux transporter MFP subunit
MRKRTKVLLWIVIFAVVVAVFAATAIRRLRPEEVQSIESVQQAEGIPVDYIESRAMTVNDWREFVGVAEGLEQVDLVSDYRTRVNSVHARVGDEVRRGKVVVSLDRYDPARIVINLETAQINYETAKRDSLRMEELFKSGAISQQQLDHVRAQTDAANAAYQTALRAVDLDTPFSGVLTALYVEGGDYTDAGQVVATVASYDEIRIPLEVSSSERALIEVGQPVRLRMETVPKELSSPLLLGEVVKAALSADSETRLYQVEVIVDNPEHVLKPGSLVTPEILVASTEGKPVVPRAALIRKNGSDHVYTISKSNNESRAVLRAVSAGMTDGSLLAIERGLNPGEWVVVRGQSKLEEGIKVKLHADLTSEYFAAVETTDDQAETTGAMAEDIAPSDKEKP